MMINLVVITELRLGFSYLSIDLITSLFLELEKPQELFPSTKLCT